MNNPHLTNSIFSTKHLLCGLLLAFTSIEAAHSTLPGTMVVDTKNYWGHNGKFSKKNYKGAYVVCDGYIGSPLLPNSRGAVETFLDNCEITPPPGSLPIIDSAENHSTHYGGYPAYPVQPEGSEQTYFLCDGFLSSSAWCSYEAHSEAQKLRRAAESRFWEAGSIPVIAQDQSSHLSVEEEIVEPLKKKTINKPIKHSERLKPELIKLKQVRIIPKSEEEAEERFEDYKLIPMTKQEVEDRYNVDLDYEDEDTEERIE